MMVKTRSALAVAIALIFMVSFASLAFAAGKMNITTLISLI